MITTTNQTAQDQSHIPEPDYATLNRRNDSRLLTPLLLMALIVAGGFLAFAVFGPSGANVQQTASAPVQPQQAAQQQPPPGNTAAGNTHQPSTAQTGTGRPQ